MKVKKTRQGIIKAFNAAIEGIIYTFKFERNMKIHYCLAAAVLIGSLFFKLNKVEMLILLFSISLVVITEMFNTAIEKTIDMVTDEYHPLAKIAKDVAAGAVVIAALNSVVVGYMLFYDQLTDISKSLIFTIRKSEPHVTLICIVLVLISVVVVKALTSTGTPLKGGMPSGHSAISFSIATAISLITEDPICILLSYLMAIITAQSRVDSEVHSILEVVVGALFGSFLTLFIFIIFKI